MVPSVERSLKAALNTATSVYQTILFAVCVKRKLAVVDEGWHDAGLANYRSLSLRNPEITTTD
jgi:hypothetical protein